MHQICAISRAGPRRFQHSLISETVNGFVTAISEWLWLLGSRYDAQFTNRSDCQPDGCPRVHICLGPDDRDSSVRNATLPASGAPTDHQPIFVQRNNRRWAPFFGGVSRGLAEIVEKAVSKWGLPNGYILGEEASGAFIGGLRYGDGTLYTRNAGDVRVFWEGPSFGFDFGADGARTMMLIYSLPQTGAIFSRFGGINGSAYLVGGFGMTALTGNNIVVVPIRSGIGLRLGANLGWLKFTDNPTWNPF